jgi:hypothetical protein
MFFEFILMTLKNHMFKIDLNRFFKNASKFFYFVGCLNKHNKQTSRDEIMDLKIFFG